MGTREEHGTPRSMSGHGLWSGGTRPQEGPEEDVVLAEMDAFVASLSSSSQKGRFAHYFEESPPLLGGEDQPGGPSSSPLSSSPSASPTRSSVGDLPSSPSTGSHDEGVVPPTSSGEGEHPSPISETPPPPPLVPSVPETPLESQKKVEVVSSRTSSSSRKKKRGEDSRPVLPSPAPKNPPPSKTEKSRSRENKSSGSDKASVSSSSSDASSPTSGVVQSQEKVSPLPPPSTSSRGLPGEEKTPLSPPPPSD